MRTVLFSLLSLLFCTQGFAQSPNEQVQNLVVIEYRHFSSPKSPGEMRHMLAIVEPRSSYYVNNEYDRGGRQAPLFLGRQVAVKIEGCVSLNVMHGQVFCTNARGQRVTFATTARGLNLAVAKSRKFLTLAQSSQSAAPQHVTALNAAYIQLEPGFQAEFSPKSALLHSVARGSQRLW